MNSIQLPSRDKLILGIMGFIGIISLVAIFLNDDALHTRFWSSLLHNGVFFTLISMMAIFFVCVSRTAYAGWNVGFKRVWEAMAQFMWVGFFIMMIIALGVYFGWHHLYHWSDQETVANDAVLKGKSSFLNKNIYTFLGLGILASWIFFATKIRTLSIAEDDHGDGKFEHYNKMKFWAAIFLPVAGFTSAVVIWLWYMSIDPHWYSTMFAWYTGTSCFVSMIALTILFLIYLKSRGYYHNVNQEHFHDLGKFMFAFSVFWTYLWFSQYMLIWYGNNGEETVYFQTRIQQYPILFFGNLILNFALPFLILMRNDNKRKYGTLIGVGIIVFFGHWWDTFQMVKPGTLHTSHEVLMERNHAAAGNPSTHELNLSKQKDTEHTNAGHEQGAAEHVGHDTKPTIGYYIPGLADIGLLIGFLALFFATTLHFLSKAPLVAKNDPFYEESLHHHV
ncbi:MAG: hypothetical protein WAS55_01945 [Saprospiraceae bacterium]|nr:hypothetical protein [Saprospiraceae bacterium]MBK8449640.1 hypothetical protein [Saprospiraceae bacterium]MBK8484304.1 hypothetical protein [Saprospiraceae bacterium]MBK9221688.1 hypothetical protein [Saprospiraceae bacterium]